ncbi:hypothetical protein NUACC21_20560 [Scytonema sp. NUACC21]
MNATEIVNLLRAVADAIEAEPQLAKSVERHIAENLNIHKKQEFSKASSKKPKITSKNLVNGETLLAQCRQILREQGEEELKTYLTGMGEQIKEILKYGHLDPNRLIRRRKNLDSIIEYIIQTLKTQEHNGKTFASSILLNEKAD